MENSPLIIALDVRNREEAMSLVEQTKSYVSIYKVGPVLYTRYGPDIIRSIQQAGRDVFLDLKLHDIPNTVGNTAGAICDLQVAMFTVHISGGLEMLKAAVNGCKKSQQTLKRPPIVLGVTVLTSIGDVRTEEIVKMARTGRKTGLNGIVISALEAQSVREVMPEDFVIVTPGIRPKSNEMDDQKRVATPDKAILEGADYIVVGRPVIQSNKPEEAAKQIYAECIKAQEKRRK